MKIKNLHPWNLNLKEAEKIQEKLQKKIILKSPYASIQKIKTVAGTDVHFSADENFGASEFQKFRCGIRGCAGETIWLPPRGDRERKRTPEGREPLWKYPRRGYLVSAGIIISSFPELKILEKVRVETKTNQLFPYVPGFLSFREIPFLLTAFKKIKIVPDVILCDGQGIAHPRRTGLATHLGIILDKPTIGCAKSLLYGDYEKLPERAKGSYSYLRGEKGDKGEKGEIVGAVLRTKDNVRPVFVSPGHKINLKLAIEVVLNCCKEYRLPEPLRFAHQLT